jgi:hypothetical protein
MKWIAVILITIIVTSYLSINSGACPNTASKTASSDTTKTKIKPKKKRVRKPDTPTTTTSTVATSDEESEEDESFIASCLGNCLGSLFDMILSGDDEDETEDYSTNQWDSPPQITIRSYGTEHVDVDLPCSAIVSPAGTSSLAGGLWDGPGGISIGAELQTKLTPGTEITVVDQAKTMLSETQEETWVKVKVKESSVEGWMKISDIGLPGSIPEYTQSTSESKPEIIKQQTPLRDSANAKPAYSQTEEAIASEEPSETIDRTRLVPLPDYRNIRDSRWQLIFGVSTPLFARSAISEEYHKYVKGKSSGMGFSFDGAIKLQPSDVFLLSGTFSYAHIGGVPQYNYVIGNKIDSPQESDLDILSMGIGAGQLYSFAAGKGFFTWSVGPAFYRVNESAKIDMYVDEILVGQHVDEISDWKIGAALDLEIGGAPVDRFILSFYTGVSIVSWKAKEEKSLTLDFLEHSSFTFFTFGLRIGTAFY